MVRYVQSDRLTYKYVLAELEHDIGFRQGALKLLKDIEISSTYTESKAASGLLNYWLIKNELPCYYLGQIVFGIELEKFFSSHNYIANRNQYIEQYLKDFRIDSKEIIYKLELAGFCIPSFLRMWVIEWDRDAYYADINANLISEPNKAVISADIGSHAGTEPKPEKNNQKRLKILNEWYGALCLNHQNDIEAINQEINGLTNEEIKTGLANITQANEKFLWVNGADRWIMDYG